VTVADEHPELADHARPGPRRPVTAVLRGLVRLYQRYVSPLSPPRCRFYPSCSSYAVLALEKHGAVRGTRLAVWRVLRCNPWNSGGVDDVPGTGPAADHDH
jgi:putative membrane protein insertion efficiency factor